MELFQDPGTQTHWKVRFQGVAAATALSLIASSNLRQKSISRRIVLSPLQ
jgi:hypothetical protein